MPLTSVPVARHADFRSHTGALELVDTETMAAALDVRWQQRPGKRSGLLLIDPAGRWAGGIVTALSEATGSLPDRVRLLSPVGLREIATIDELHLPPVPGRPAVVRHLRARRLDVASPSPTLERLWRHTAQVALLLDTVGPDDLARWAVNTGTLAHRLGETGPRWSIFLPPGASQQHFNADSPDGLRRTHWLPQPNSTAPLASPSAVWNVVFRTWVDEDGVPALRAGQ
jgi:hypothetical protein